MKSVIALALAGAAVAVPAGWQDADPAKSTTTTAASTTWADYSVSSTTTTPVADESKTWLDVSVSSTEDPSSTWADYTVSTPVADTTSATWVRRSAKNQKNVITNKIPG
jgi:hypothetical protein